MELLSVIRARSIWLIDFAELNPGGRKITHELVGWLKDYYNFSKAPSSAQDFDETKALAFLDGSFQIKVDTLIAVDLRVYNERRLLEAPKALMVAMALGVFDSNGIELRLGSMRTNVLSIF